MRCMQWVFAVLAASTTFVGSRLIHAEEPWSTYRGNSARTGNTDGIPGPAKPQVIWAYKAQDHFIASPVPVGNQVVFSGLGAFNRPTMVALPLEPKAKLEPTWTRSAPYLKLPTVSSPAVQEGKLIFGDGMHQTDGAILHCISADGSVPLWQLKIPGELVHFEGSPTVSDQRIYIGGGAAGVICVQLDRASIEGKEYDLPTIRRMQEKRWKELQGKYEVEKKKDEFALPPNEDQLYAAVPKVLWEKGKIAWHVDAPVNLVGDRLLVTSAFLEKEKVGDRALYCLSSKNGETIWKKPLKVNPWGGASVSDNIAVVTGSTISYDPKLLKGAKGDVVAFDLTTGDEKWRKELPGGVLGCAAIANGTVVCTATDGKVRGYALKDGERKFLYDAKTPIFAPPSVVADVAYVADLKGVIHAIDMKTGAARWTLDLGTDPQVKAPGMVYGGIAIHGGKLYLATCNLEGAFARQTTVVVCIGAP